ncbi:hypothetical protein QNM99_30030 [Pseudomonas sp. PCH446]
MERDNGRFELLIRKVNDVFGGSWAMFRAWRTDVDEDEDAPVMGRKMILTLTMKAHMDSMAGMKVFGLRVSSGEMSGLTINPEACV